MLFLYYGLLCWILYYILHRRDMREARMYLGTETYYERFPKERKRDERIAKIQKLIAEVDARNGKAIAQASEEVRNDLEAGKIVLEQRL